MARNVGKRLSQLSARRRGYDRIATINESTALDELVSLASRSEAWEKRAADRPNTRYALGSMQAVDSRYTQISVETASRVSSQIKQGLELKFVGVEFQLQGSVPLDIHIRGVSDVDLLTFGTGLLTYDTFGARARAGFYTRPTTTQSYDFLERLRKQCGEILVSAFPKAKVDQSGGKAIALSGGSLARPVDVVPSHWFDTVQYQETGLLRDRGVTIADIKSKNTLDNWPFLHIHHINAVDGAVFGGVKKAIRLCKNIKADAIAEGTSVTLPSFDITSVLYHADRQALASGLNYEFAILAETQRHLDYLATHIEYAKTLKVPDGSRTIFDSDDKIRGLIALSIEVDDLLREVAKEQNGSLFQMAEPPLDVSRNVLLSFDARSL